MRPALALSVIVACSLVLAGCQMTLQNDNLAHAMYDCPVHQGLIQVNDATDAHALADTGLAYDWAVLMDDLGADAYYELHLFLNQPSLD